MSERRARIGLTVSIASLLVPVLGAIFLFSILVSHKTDESSNAFSHRTLYVDPLSKAAEAAAAAEQGGRHAYAAILGRIAAQPTALWLTPEKYPTETITEYLNSIVSAATLSRTLPVFVVYGIPHRDCTNYSTGGLSEQEYPRWIDAIALSLRNRTTVVILEPDSLAQAAECTSSTERITQVRTALDTLLNAGVSVYLDAGHSQWIKPETMAERLIRAGIHNANGFATNVSNYQTTAAEKNYAETLSALVGGAHYLIDTSRNGNGSNGEWCNPSGRALGELPSVATMQPRLDATLWVKPPGESDGTCRGGPAAGEWWDTSARALAEQANW